MCVCCLVWHPLVSCFSEGGNVCRQRGDPLPISLLHIQMTCSWLLLPVCRRLCVAGSPFSVLELSWFNRNNTCWGFVLCSYVCVGRWVVLLRFRRWHKDLGRTNTHQCSRLLLFHSSYNNIAENKVMMEVSRQTFFSLRGNISVSATCQYVYMDCNNGSIDLQNKISIQVFTFIFSFTAHSTSDIREFLPIETWNKNHPCLLNCV